MPDTIAAIATCVRGRRGRHRAPKRRGDPVRARGAVHAGGRSFGRGAPPRRMTYGTVRDAEGRTLDHALAVVFSAGHSYTGEESAELHCHGSPGRFAGGPARRVCRRRAAGAGGRVYRARVSERQNGPHRGGGGHRPH